MDDIIQALKVSRLKMGLTQAELGRKLGLPQSHISKIEKGLTDPRLSTIADMARLLNQELITVPIPLLASVKALANGEDVDRPLWTLDEEEDEL